MAMQIHSGWPYEGAITGNAEATDAEGIVAGMAVKKDPGTEKLVLADGTEGELSFFALKDQADNDVVFTKSLPYIVKNAVVYTDQYTAGVYAIGDPICVDEGDPGKFRKWIAMDTNPIIAYYDGVRTFEEVDFIKLILRY